MNIKRLMACVLCVVLMIMLSVAVCAEENESMDTFEKSYTLRISETHGTIEASPTTPAFWEYPILRAGETYKEGTFTVCNDSDYTVSMQLNEMTLPYGDADKLAYLDHLQLTVLEGETVIYDDTYAHVNDEDGGLSIAFDAMAPGEEHTYTVKLRCAFDYKGDPYADASQVAWVFGASTQTTTYEEPTGLPQWAKITVITFAVMFVLLILIMIIRAIVSAKKKNEKTIDKQA